MRNRCWPCFPSPGGVVGALTRKHTQAIECNEICDEFRIRVRVSGGERRGTLGRTWELGLPEGVGTGWTKCELHRLGRNSTFTLDMNFTRHTQTAPVGCFTEKHLTLPRKAHTHSYSPTHILTHIHRPPAQTPSLTLHTHTSHPCTHIYTHLHSSYNDTYSHSYSPYVHVHHTQSLCSTHSHSQTYPRTPSYSHFQFHTQSHPHTHSNLYTHTHHSLAHSHYFTHPQSYSFITHTPTQAVFEPRQCRMNIMGFPL